MRSDRELRPRGLRRLLAPLHRLRALLPVSSPSPSSPDDVRRELEGHLDLEAERLTAGGMDPILARAAARRRLGNVGLTSEDVRAVWHWTWLHDLGRDVRYAFRGLRHSPAYALAAAATLALGIGASTAVFSMADHLLRRAFPLLPEQELVWVVQRSKECPTCDNASPAAFVALRDHARSYAAVSAATNWSAALRDAHGSELVDGYLVSANVFSAITAPFAAGHGFAPDADQPGNDGVAILSYDFWRRRFAGSAGVVDSVITLNGRARRVVGVLGRGVVFPTAVSVYAPLVITAADAADHASRYLDIFGRLAPAATVASARAEAAVISRRMAVDAPATDVGWTLVPRALQEFHTDDVRIMIRLFAAAVALVLFAACFSVANLALARGTTRRREMALRAALGGRPGRLARALLAEALLVAAAGAAIGVALAAWALRAAAGVVPPSFARFAPGFALITIDGRSLAFTAGLCVFVTLVFALLPALRASRPDLSRVLGDGGRGGTGGLHGTRVRSALVVAEVSMALVLVTGAALLARSVHNMVTGDPGVRLDRVLTTHLTLPRGVPDSVERGFLARLEEHLRADPRVAGAGLVSTTPLSNSWWGTLFTIPGREPPPNGRRLSANDQRITAGYFPAMRIRVVSGRGFDARDTDGAQRVAVINAYMAGRYWPGDTPLGHELRIGTETWTIVGVASNVHHGGFDSPLRDEIYRPVLQALQPVMDLVVWTRSDPEAMRDAIRGLVGTVDPAAAVGDVMTMREMEARHVSAFRLMADVLTTFAGVALLIAVVGLYGVIAYGVTQRTREMGVRMAMGATSQGILWLVAGGALRLTMLGVAIGGAGALAFAQLLRSVLYGVTATDPATPALASLGIVVVAVVAALVPAWRASRVNPATVLRE